MPFIGFFAFTLLLILVGPVGRDRLQISPNIIYLLQLIQRLGPR